MSKAKQMKAWPAWVDSSELELCNQPESEHQNLGAARMKNVAEIYGGWWVVGRRSWMDFTVKHNYWNWSQSK